MQCLRARLDEYSAIIAGLVVFVLSYMGAGYYVEGDQAYYSDAYAIVQGLSRQEARDLYLSHVSGADYVHFVLVWLASSAALPKIMVMSFLNGTLAVYSVRLFQYWGADIRIACAIVFTNFYMYVLYFAAERLKVGFIFIFLSLLYVDKLRIGLPLLAIALFSHFSVLLLGLGIWYDRLISQFKAESNKRKLISALFFSLVAITALLLIEREMFFAKAKTYLQARGDLKLADFVPFITLLGLSIHYSRRPLWACALYIPVIVGIILFGGSRINMFAYFIFLYISLRVRGGFNAGVVLVSSYLAYKSVVFSANVYHYGHGFPAP